MFTIDGDGDCCSRGLLTTGAEIRYATKVFAKSKLPMYMCDYSTSWLSH